MRFVSVRFVSVRFVSVRFVSVRFVSFVSVRFDLCFTEMRILQIETLLGIVGTSYQVSLQLINW